MIETVEDREFTVTNEDGSVSKVTGQVTTIDHETVDKDGNPKISVKINVPGLALNAVPGQNG